MVISTCGQYGTGAHTMHAMSGDVTISGPSNDAAENLSIQVVDDLAGITDVDILTTGTRGITICVSSGDMPEAYQHLSSLGYEVHVVPTRRSVMRVRIRMYATI